MCRVTDKIISISLLAYYGGKFKLMPEIIDRLPPHINKFDVIIDVFSGGASVSGTIVKNNLLGTNTQLILNDKNTDLANVYKLFTCERKKAKLIAEAKK